MSRVVLAFLLTLASLSATFAISAGQRPPASRDLPQDYVAARAWLDGGSPYQPLADLYQRYGFPPADDDVLVPYNPHPPTGILLTAPLALLAYDDAVSVLLGVQLAALALTWVMSCELFRPRLARWAWALAGGAFGLWAPVWQGLAWGQPVALLALGILATWQFARAEYGFAFGLPLSVTMLVRPFTALLVVVGVTLGVKQRALAAVGVMVGAAVPFAAVGIWPGDWLRLASHAGGYVPACGSLPGVLHIGAAGGIACFAIAFAGLLWLAHRRWSLDSLAALACVSALLAYPLSWFQYDTCLIPAVAWVLARLSRADRRAAMWALVAYLALRSVPDLMPGASGKPITELLARHKNWLQVIARGFLLLAVVLVSERTGDSRA